MNWQHLAAFTWLRWRLTRNMIRRGGVANTIAFVVIGIIALALAVGLAIGGFALGHYGLGNVSGDMVLYVWGGVTLGFFFWWMVGLVAELQRAEALSLQKFLHLPVSPAGVFVVNYLSSWLSLRLIVLVPGMLGLALGLVSSHGPLMLIQFPLILAFLVMTTALTYQLQGWLAALMVNQRRRRTIIVLITGGFILLAQLPNLLNLGVLQPWLHQPKQKIAKPGGANPPVEVEPDIDPELRQKIEHGVWLASAILPPLWLAAGAGAAGNGNIMPGLLGFVGLSLIGAVSLWRSYRTTVRIYTGYFDTIVKPAAKSPTPTTAAPTNAYFMERRFSRVPEQAATIALASFRSLTRAPEAKMMLLSTLILVVMFGAMFITRGGGMTTALRPFAAVGAMAVVLLAMLNITGNQFGFDRSGFRVYVLSAARRRDVLFGKNLAMLPFAAVASFLLVCVIEIVVPLRLDHLAALPFQFIAMYMLFCLLTNSMSIAAPMPIAAGSLRPSNPKFVPMLMQFAVILVLLPLIVFVTIIPLGTEALLDYFQWHRPFPVYLPLMILECAAVALTYYLVLGGQGQWLQNREKAILEIVAAKAE